MSAGMGMGPMSRAKRSLDIAWTGLSARGTFQAPALHAWCLAYLEVGSVPPLWLTSPQDDGDEEAASYVGDLPLRRAWSTHLARWALAP